MLYEVITKWNVDDYEIGGASPATGSCDNWGFQCCNSGTEVGEGVRVRTYDCANYCYQHCNRLPIVLFFNTDPLLNQLTRVLPISKSNSLVRFGFEITERETVKSFALLEKFVQNLKIEGFNFAIDDFGSGFSTFHYIKKFPIDYIIV